MMGVNMFYTQAQSLQVEILSTKTIENWMASKELLIRTNAELVSTHEKKDTIRDA
jgi:hypothetical protein